MWTIKPQKEFIWASKLVHEWNGRLGPFLAVLKKEKITGNICFSEQVFYRKKSLDAPVLHCNHKN